MLWGRLPGSFVAVLSREASVPTSACASRLAAVRRGTVGSACTPRRAAGTAAHRGTTAPHRWVWAGSAWGLGRASVLCRRGCSWREAQGRGALHFHPKLVRNRAGCMLGQLCRSCAVPADIQSRLCSHSLLPVQLHRAQSRTWIATVLAVGAHMAAMRGGLPRQVQLEGRGHAAQLGPCSCVQVAQEAVELAGCLPQRSRGGPGRPSLWQARSAPLCLRASRYHW